MGILSGLMGNASEVDATKLQDEFSQVLCQDRWSESRNHRFKMSPVLRRSWPLT
jgi:hypothetical protein